MSTQALIRLDWQSQQASMTEAAAQLKAHALSLSALVGRVHDAISQEAAVKAQAEIADVRSSAEKARKMAKAPALEFGREIDRQHQVFDAELLEEHIRLTALIGDYQQLELAKAQAAERLRQAEERKAAEERRQAELAALSAAEEEKRKLAEAEREVARLAAEAKSKREKEILAQQQAEIDRQRALSEAKTHEELDRIQEQHSNAMAAIAEQPKYEPARAAGQRVSEDWEITAIDLPTLYRFHANCVRLEPLVGEIKALLKAGAQVRGVTAKKVVKSGTVRSATRTIDIIGEKAA